MKTLNNAQHELSGYPLSPLIRLQSRILMIKQKRRGIFATYLFIQRSFMGHSVYAGSKVTVLNYGQRVQKRRVIAKEASPWAVEAKRRCDD
jgi:hypothetical protein